MNVSTPIAFSADLTANTTALTGLTPSTTYYVRVRAENGDLFMTAFSVPGSTVTLQASAPSGLTGTALGVSSISWTWSSVANASSYNLYMATSTATLIANVASPSYNEIGLSTNIAYGRVVTAVVSASGKSVIGELADDLYARRHAGNAAV